jgi:hypothetical protein
MSGKKWLRGVWTLALAMAMAATAAAGGPDVVGSLVGSRNATLDGQTPLAHTVLLSGDKLKVTDGLAMMTLDRGNRMALGADSEVSFQREAKMLTVVMAQGILSLYLPPEGSELRVKAGNVTVAPVQGGKVLGDIAVADGMLMVRVNDGLLKIEKDGTTSEVGKGHTMTIPIATAASSSPGNSRLGNVLDRAAHFDVGSSDRGASAAAMVIGQHRHRHVSPVHHHHH